MDNTVVVNDLSSMLKVIRLVVEMVRHDVQMERQDDLTVSHGRTGPNPYKYDPTEW